MDAIVVAVVEAITGDGLQFRSRSAEPEVEVEALLPCLAIRTRGEATIEDVVETLYVLWPSPPVPTMSHYHLVKFHPGRTEFKASGAFVS